MYVPAWFMIGIFVFIVASYFYLNYREGRVIDNQALSTEEMWRQGNLGMAKVLKKVSLPEEFLQDEINMVKRMEKDMIRLREKYQNDPKKQREIARNWMNYANAVVEIKNSREEFDTDLKEGAFDRFDERTKKTYLAIEEIASRVKERLEKDWV